MAVILLVEDNQHIREAAAEFLRLEGHTVQELDTGAGVLDAVRSGGIDLLILDVMLPKASGFALAREIRGFSGVPIVFLTAKDSESDRIIGFELGADDYVVKPFSPKELVLRVRALLRRVQDDGRDTGHIQGFRLQNHRLEIDGTAHLVRLDTHQVELTSSEWEILLHITRYPGQVFSREALLRSCLGYSADGITRTVDTHIGNLRQKLGEAEWIETVRGYGYRFGGEPE
ncbi:response regulator transcription factor [Spirochaeta africana]|uniref:Response regulator with CheY-like receiver domain and winged-helix DNA-binding domain n=1 Tax=Spirochaeta africana (strain ATCC 700263 / DSM 8902 / Z-7692) TaxID=889378 RepID=H9UFZ2_SPIAZ|nr:response regulator transcription factor [Spirochaeta africana]AFG36435.1 response regulator with CheY-like receiver domain and winged-helix DNA-binding domain [Spirochaeta africana DSM 8902]